MVTGPRTPWDASGYALFGVYMFAAGVCIGTAIGLLVTL